MKLRISAWSLSYIFFRNEWDVPYLIYRAPSVLCAMVTHEAQVASGIDTLFRSNTIGTKAIDMYAQTQSLSRAPTSRISSLANYLPYRFMKLVAHEYLQEIVYPTVKLVYKEKKSFEV